MKGLVCTVAGVAGAVLAAAFGEWSFALTLLLILMAADYISGLVVAGVFHASPKSESGALESRAGWKGLCRKFFTLIIVIVARWLDLTLGVAFIRDGVIYCFMANELISLTENAGLMGVPMPKVIRKAIDVLTSKGEKEDRDG